jgi:CPA1 family monovalent cation:H+ antiporter
MPISNIVLEAVLILAAGLAIAIVARYLRVPYTVGLVLAGLGVGVFAKIHALAFSPDLVMLVFLPPLLFAGAWNISTTDLRRAWLPIALYAVVGVAIGVAISVLVLVFGGRLPMETAFLFGAIVSATDPVAVLAIFRSLRVDPRLATIVEGESLFNDATAVIGFRIALAFALLAGGGTMPTAGAFAWQFVVSVAIGATVGCAVGAALALLLRLLDDFVLEAAGTTVAAYGAYLLGDRLHGSGILAVICAAIVLSSLARRTSSFTTSRESINQFWEFAAFIANSLLFFLIGLEINVPSLIAAGGATALGIVAVIVGRIVTVYGLGTISGVLGQRISAAWMHVLTLGGLRGALSMALVLSLPANFPDRSLLTSMVFSVVLFTLVVQGLLIRPALETFCSRPSSS